MNPDLPIPSPCNTAEPGREGSVAVEPRLELGRYRFEVAQSDAYRDQVREFLYATFVVEIPHYTTDVPGRFVDRFDEDNLYLLALCDDRVVGTMALRDRRPFSLDERLGDLETYFPGLRSACEVRLLAVRPEHRRGRVFLGLRTLAEQVMRARGYDLILISGIVTQEELYRGLGFEPFGRLVGHEGAWFQPMVYRVEGGE